MGMAIKYTLGIFLLGLLFLELLICPAAISKDSRDSSSPTGSTSLTLVEAATCEGIQNSLPENPAVVFPITIGKVFCFTSFDPVPEETFVYHYWFHRDKFSTRIKLSLKPPRWSTYSSVHLREADKGPWRVEIRDQQDRVIRYLRFSIAD